MVARAPSRSSFRAHQIRFVKALNSAVVMTDPLRKAQTSLLSREIERLLDTGRAGVLVTIIHGSEEVGAKLLIDDAGNVFGAFDAKELELSVVQYAPAFLGSRVETRTFLVSELATALTSSADVRLLFERIQVQPRIVICGAGHVGAALAKLAAFTGYEVSLLDDRGEFLKPERFPAEQIELIKAESWSKAVCEAVGNGAGVSVAIVTRGHNEDEQCLRAVMQTNPDYIGMIGSKRRTNIVLQRLRDTGFDEEKVRRVRAPVGLDIGAVTPEEVAVAILAEIIAERRGGNGGSLSSWRRE
jgi:xanthine dehydrogenase accessory factor